MQPHFGQGGFLDIMFQSCPGAESVFLIPVFADPVWAGITLLLWEPVLLRSPHGLYQYPLKEIPWFLSEMKI